MARHAMPCRVLKLATEIDCSQQYVSARQTAIFAQLTAKTEDAARHGRGASIIDVNSIEEGGGQPKVDHSIKLLVMKELIKGGGAQKIVKNS